MGSGLHVPLLLRTLPTIDSKFSFLNQVNVTLCQHYPSALNYLTSPEEYRVAKAHPGGVVLKLRPGGRSSPVNYHALRESFYSHTVIPRDSSDLTKP
jgi:hypothetical protein